MTSDDVKIKTYLIFKIAFFFSCMFALKRGTKERIIPHKLKYRKSTTQNTEGELYLRIGKRGIIRNWSSDKIIYPKTTLLSQCDW